MAGSSGLPPNAEKDLRIAAAALSRLAGAIGGSGTPTPPDAGGGKGGGEEKKLSQLDQVRNRLAQLVTHISGIQAGFSGVISGLQAGLSGLGSQLASFVESANPGVVLAWNQALRNAMSAIGQIMTPALIKMTGIVQQIGNAIASLNDETKSLMSGLAMASGFAAALGGVATAIGGVIAVLGGWTTLLLALGAVFVGVMVATSEWEDVTKGFREILTVVGGAVQGLAAAVAAGIGGLVGPIKQIVTALAPVLGAVGGAVGSILGLVGKVVEALAPVAAAVIGALAPVVEVAGVLLGALAEIFGAWVEMFGTFLKPMIALLNMLAVPIAAMGKLWSALFQVLAAVGTGIVNTFTKIITSLQKLIPFEWLAEMMGHLADAIGLLADKVLAFVNRVRRFFGEDEVKPKKFDPDKNTALAVGKASITSDLGGIVNKVYANAAMAGVASIDQKQLDKLASIDTTLKQMAGAGQKPAERSDRNDSLKRPGWDPYGRTAPPAPPRPSV